MTRVVKCDAYPHPIFRTSSELLERTGLGKGDFLQVRYRRQIAPIVRVAVAEAMRTRPAEFFIPDTPTLATGRILLQETGERQARQWGIDPYRVFVKYLAYNSREAEAYKRRQFAEYQGASWPGEACEKPSPVIGLIMTVSLVDHTVNFIDSELGDRIRGYLENGSGFSEGALSLIEDVSYAPLDDAYAFQWVCDGRGIVVEFMNEEERRILDVFWK